MALSRIPSMKPLSQPKTGIPASKASWSWFFSWEGSALTRTMASVPEAATSSMRLARAEKSLAVSTTVTAAPWASRPLWRAVTIWLVPQAARERRRARVVRMTVSFFMGSSSLR